MYATHVRFSFSSPKGPAETGQYPSVGDFQGEFRSRWVMWVIDLIGLVGLKLYKFI